MSGIMYKNRPYAGGGGGAGGASALSDLTDTSISSPTNGQVLKYNNGFWENDDESGGTTVVANPTGTPTEELSTIQIGQDIYEIVGGGSGGGGSYEYTQLYTGTTNPETMTLNDDISNYDVIYIRTANTNGYSVTALFRAQDLIDGIGQNVQFGIANDSEFFYFRVTSQTLFTRFSSNAQFPVEIGGMKFGGGSGGSGITYGYINPTGSASDGALYILLDNDDKERGKFLYISNEWKLISGNAYVEAYVLYDNGTEEVPWTVSGGTKNADSIALNVGAGTFSNYAVTDDAIDLTDYATIHIEYMFNNQSYEENVDISSYTGSKYISFTYLTDFSHNEAAIGLTDTKTGATTIRLKNNTSATTNQILYYMELR